MKPANVTRCGWARNELAIQYHDKEWGVPVHDDRTLFEFLILEGAQAGLSWDTILRKRDHYRRVFDNFDAATIAKYNKRKIAQLLKDPGIVRNRLKIEAAIGNASALLRVRDEFGSFDAYIWKFVDNIGHKARRSTKEIPARSAESDAMSKDLKRRGFSFVGSTICYAFIQAVGMVNDHLKDCFRYAQLAQAKTRIKDDPRKRRAASAGGGRLRA